MRDASSNAKSRDQDKTTLHQIWHDDGDDYLVNTSDNTQRVILLAA